MKICLLGEFSGDLDEGMRIVSSHFAEELSNQHQILTSDLRNVFTKEFWKNIKNFNPDIIHYIHGPSIRSFILLKMLSFRCRNAKTVMSAMHPGLSFLSKAFIPLLKPDIILVQSYETEAMFKRLGCLTEFLPCGVDVNKFRPVTWRVKEELREKYGIDKDKFVILHIGSIKEGRNIQLLKKLQGKDNQVLIVGSSSTGMDSKVYEDLVESGCVIWLKYIENIEEVYAISDCYVYPTVRRYDLLDRAIADSIEMPLTVLEAMACNLPVITTRFGALPRVFKDGNGLFFVENEKGIFTASEETKNRSKINTREKVMPYSWDNVSKKLERIYETLLRSA